MKKDFYRVDIITEKKGGEVSTESIYFSDEEEAIEACRMLAGFYNDDEKRNAMITKVSHQEEDAERVMRHKRFFATHLDFYKKFDENNRKQEFKHGKIEVFDPEDADEHDD